VNAWGMGIPDLCLIPLLSVHRANLVWVLLLIIHGVERPDCDHRTLYRARVLRVGILVQANCYQDLFEGETETVEEGFGFSTESGRSVHAVVHIHLGRENPSSPSPTALTTLNFSIPSGTAPHGPTRGFFVVNNQ